MNQQPKCHPGIATLAITSMFLLLVCWIPLARPDVSPTATTGTLKDVLASADGLPLRTRLELPAIIRAAISRNKPKAQAEYAKAFEQLDRHDSLIPDPEQVEAIRVKYQIARRKLLSDWQTGLASSTPTYLTRSLPDTPLDLVLKRGAGNPIMALAAQTGEKVLNDGISQLVQPGMERVKVFVDVPFKKGEEKQFLDRARAFLHPNLLGSAEFRTADLTDQAALVRALQSHLRALPQPRLSAIVGSQVTAQARANETVGRLRELQQITANLIDRQLQVSRDFKGAVDAVDGLLAGGLSPRDRLDLVAKGLGNVPAVQKVAEAVRSKLSKSLQGADGYLAAGQQLLGLADRVGIKSDTVKAAGKVLQVGRAVLKGISSGNPVAAVGALADALFGGPDPAEERHKEVMEKLGVIEGKLNEVLENQERLRLAVEEVKTNIRELAVQVRQQHVEVMSKLEQIEKNVLINRDLLKELLEKDFRTLGAFLEIDKESTYVQKKAWFELHGDQYADADKVLSAMVANGFPQVSQYFLLRTDTSRDVQAYLKESVEPLIGYFEEQTGTDPQGAAHRLLPPIFTINDLRNAKATTNLSPEDSFQRDFKTYLSTKPVTMYGGLVLRFVPYIFLVGKTAEGRRLLSAQSFRTPEPPESRAAKRATALRYLRHALYLVNLALAQRVLLSGQPLLPAISQKLTGGALDDRTVSVLRQHPLIARNALAYFMAERVRQAGGGVLAYTFAFESPDPDYLGLLTATGPTRFTFERRKGWYAEGGRLVEREGWHLVLKDLRVPVPSPEDFDSGRLWHEDEMPALYQMREALIDEIASFDFLDSLSAAEQRTLSRIALQP
jgi:hypothetical protein